MSRAARRVGEGVRARSVSPAAVHHTTLAEVELHRPVVAPLLHCIDVALQTRRISSVANSGEKLAVVRVELAR